jgi:hypothetical protein
MSHLLSADLSYTVFNELTSQFKKILYNTGEKIHNDHYSSKSTLLKE